MCARARPRPVLHLLVWIAFTEHREIGERLYLSEKTVKNYMSNVLRTLGMHRRTEAAVFAAKAAQRREKDLRL